MKNPVTKADIIEILMDNEYRYHVMPHSGMINDWFLSYVQLARAVTAYLGSDYKDSYEVE
jgi:hypothetical protein